MSGHTTEPWPVEPPACFCDVVAFDWSPPAPASPRPRWPGLVTAASLAWIAGLLLASWAYEGGFRSMELDAQAMAGLIQQRQRINRMVYPQKLEAQVAAIRRAKGMSPMPPWSAAHDERTRGR